MSESSESAEATAEASSEDKAKAVLVFQRMANRAQKRAVEFGRGVRKVATRPSTKVLAASWAIYVITLAISGFIAWWLTTVLYSASAVVGTFVGIYFGVGFLAGLAYQIYNSVTLKQDMTAKDNAHDSVFANRIADKARRKASERSERAERVVPDAVIAGAGAPA